MFLIHLGYNNSFGSVTLSSTTLINVLALHVYEFLPRILKIKKNLTEKLLGSKYFPKLTLSEN